MNKLFSPYVQIILLAIFCFYEQGIEAQSWSINTTGKYMYNNPTDTKIGIGTSAPEEKLHVVWGVLKIGQWYSEDCRKSSLLRFGKDNIIQIGEWEGVNTLSFQANRYSFTKGNVGIGTSSPIYKLDVNGILRTTGNAYVVGNVGIGTYSPAYKLDVNGKIRLHSVDNVGGWCYSYLHWDRHTLVLGTTPGIIAHCDVALQPGGGDKDWTEINGLELFSRFQMYSAKSKTNKTLRVELCTESHCWFNNKGNVGIGTTNPQYKLDVNGDIRANGVWVKTNGADFVFNENYQLPSLNEVKQFIERHNHLPGVQSAAQMQEGGVQISELVTVLLQKIEELTLYTIDQDKQINELKQMVEELKNK